MVLAERDARKPPAAPYPATRTVAMKETPQPHSPASCVKCRHYQVTWDPHQPHGCRAHGFKSRRNPAQVVFEASGMDCQLFEPKPRR